MALREELERQGHWLFKWRSYLPLLILPIFLIALRNAEYLERVVGPTAEAFWEGFCVALSFLGLTVRCVTIGYVPKGTSGRNTRVQKTHTLNTTGMYSIVRHPLYLGNLIIFLGITLFVQTWWFVLLAMAAFWLYYERIMFAEEEFLRKEFGDVYLEWAAHTPAVLPNFRNWQKPSLSFSFRNILKREYSGFFGTMASFTFLKLVGNLLAEGTWELGWTWGTFFGVGVVVYLILRTMKKKTNLLDVEGR